MTAIPKPDRPTDDPSKLRPISVSSVWYRIIARVFVQRVNLYVPRLYSTDQHGFCPGRSTCTAMATIMPTVEYKLHHKQPIFMCAVDVDKAYDSVDRSALSIILDHVGISDGLLWKFIWNAL